MILDRRGLWAVVGGLALWLAHCGASRADSIYRQTNLVSSVPGLAPVTDANLKNPWGTSLSATSPFWVSNQVTNTATIYNGAGQKIPLVVNIPTSGSGEQGPTGQVFNSTNDFALTVGGKAFFLFANLNGTISGWNLSTGTDAEIHVLLTGDASFTGLALGSTSAGNFLYAADELGDRIRVFDGTFQPVTLAGSFTDPNLPSGFVPYNVRNIGDTLYVTYENEDTGGGVVNAFDLNGNLLRRVSSNDSSGPLQSPWGLVLAPSKFGEFSGALLVGNEGDGHISAFDPLTGKFLGQLKGRNHVPITNTGLWGLNFGNGANGSDPNKLYFVAGIQDEREGLFGSIEAVPEPSSALLLGLGGAMLVGIRTFWLRRS